MKRILLVDDDNFGRKSEGEILSGAGYAVEEASDGQMAVDYLSSNPGKRPDAILMDLHMPRLDGAEATRRIRSIGYAGPIILLTTDFLAIDNLRENNPGATEIVDRTDYIKIDAFCGLVGRHLSGE
jgi:CheY-like chemotaxis protein